MKPEWWQPIADRYGLRVEDGAVGGMIGPCSVLIEGDANDGDALTTIFVSAPIPSKLGIEREGLFESRDWQTGDRAFDRAWRLSGPRGVLAFALGREQRARMMVLVEHRARFGVVDRSIVITAHHLLEPIGVLLSIAIDLATFWAMPAAERPGALLENALNDPLPSVRAAAVEALAGMAPDRFDGALSLLRRDTDPAVQLAVALATRRTDDVRSVAIAALHDAQRRDLWDRCHASLATPEVRELAAELLVLTKSESDAETFAKVLLISIPAALDLLGHRFDRVRLAAIDYLSKHGDASVIPALRALERSSRFARRQVKACREAIICIQRDVGAVSIDARGERGAVSTEE